ncbi:hypothetical protein LEN26_015783 [Aphanomyces euteiches]|nr:hypothetical protein LEN26_015783 [Aphanomyces euteiches]KAH9102266.1 hypothetical protein AeMF1_021131 [Aphanomyces euteiches]KAH9197243.1 hypothetical protein AeNC1_000781 [Aphanomyces euteiches]
MEKNVQVAVRVRPMNEKEKALQRAGVVSAQPKTHQITVKKKTYTFDRVFGQYATQKDVFKGVVQSAVDEALSGFNCTVFAYGQTGTGKTHTIQGSLTPNDENSGIIPRAVNYIFEKLQATKSEYSVRVSFLQLYNEECKDLLGENKKDKPLRLMEDVKRGGVYCQNLEEVTTLTASHVFELLQAGAKNRISAETLLNDQSSRSHCIFTIRIHSKESNIAGEDILRSGTLNLVDLAGSECIGRSGARNVRAREAGNINQSLLTLGRVITALVDKHPHVPYRDSKLTRLLQESLGGKAMTTIIATVGPCGDNFEETQSTLDYAHRAKSIKNKPEANQRMTKHVLIKEYGQEIDALRCQLIAARNKDGIYLPPAQFAEMQERIAGLGSQLSELEEELERKSQHIMELEETLEMAKQEGQETAEKLRQTEQQLSERTMELRAKETELVEAENVLRQTQAQLQTSKDNEAHLLEEAKIATKLYQDRLDDIRLLESKLDRKESIMANNQNATNEFVENAGSQCAQFEDALQTFQQKQESEYVQIKDRLNTASSQFNKDLSVVATEVDEMRNVIQNSLDAIMAAMESHRTNISTQEKSMSQTIDTKSQTWLTQIEAIQPLVEEQASQIQNTLKDVDSSVNQLCSDVQNQLNHSMKSMETFAAAHWDQIQTIKETLKHALDDHVTISAKENAQVIHALNSTRSDIQKQLQSMQQLMQAQLDTCVASLTKSVATQITSLESQNQESASRLNNVSSSISGLLDTTSAKTKSQVSAFADEVEITRTHMDVFSQASHTSRAHIVETLKQNAEVVNSWQETTKLAMANGIDDVKHQLANDGQKNMLVIDETKRITSGYMDDVKNRQIKYTALLERATNAIDEACKTTVPQVHAVGEASKEQIEKSVAKIQTQVKALAELQDNLQVDSPTGSTPPRLKTRSSFPLFQVNDSSRGNNKRKHTDKENVATPSRLQPPKKYTKVVDAVDT